MVTDGIFKSMTDPIRRRILQVLLQNELGVSELVSVLGAPQSTVSRHLKTLREAGLVDARQSGTSATYFPVRNQNGPDRDLRDRVLDWSATQELPAPLRSRLDDVLRSRQTDSDEFFSQVAHRWDAMRTDCFGGAFHLDALTALLRVLDLGIDARKPLTSKQIAEIAKWRTRTEDIQAVMARAEAVRLAKRTLDLDDELAANVKTTTALLKDSPARVLLDKPGIGPVTAAVALTAWSHVGRLHSEAAFASLAGVSPIPASSGNTVRHRLNRGGDRRLNKALHMAVIVRMTHDAGTKAYVERRVAEGLTKREIRRVLKRYLARQIHRALTAASRADDIAEDTIAGTPLSD